jgi:hypothetical protein
MNASVILTTPIRFVDSLVWSSRWSRSSG